MAAHTQATRPVADHREEKPLRHVVMIAKFLDDNKPKIHLKSIFALFQTLLILLVSLSLLRKQREKAAIICNATPRGKSLIWAIWVCAAPEGMFFSAVLV